MPIGTEKSHVLSQLGKPYRDGDCGALFGTKITRNCEELIYPHFLAPLNPQYVGLQFVSDRLVDRYVYSSP